MPSSLNFDDFLHPHHDGPWHTDDLPAMPGTSSANTAPPPPPPPQQPSEFLGPWDPFLNPWDPSFDPWELSELPSSDPRDSGYYSPPPHGEFLSVPRRLSGLAQQRPLPAFSPQEILTGLGLTQLVPPAAPLTSNPAQYDQVQDMTVGPVPTQNPFSSLGATPAYNPAQNPQVQDAGVGYVPTQDFFALLGAAPAVNPAQYHQVQDMNVGHVPTQNPFSLGDAPAYYPAPDDPMQDVVAGPVPAPNMVALAAPPAPPQPRQQQSQVQQPPVPTASTQPQSQAATRPVLFCGQCNYNTTNREEFRRHTESVHNNIRRHRCNICNINLNDPSGLSKHKKSAKHRRQAQELGQTAATPNYRYECPTCKAQGKTDAVYARADHLKRHLKLSCGRADGTLPDGFFDGPGGMDRGKVRV